MDDAKYGELAFPDSAAHREFVREYLTREGGAAELREAVRRWQPSTVDGRQR
jgi:hypothetical protein